jgi:hypothetical protein
MDASTVWPLLVVTSAAEAPSASEAAGMAAIFGADWQEKVLVILPD